MKKKSLFRLFFGFNLALFLLLFLFIAKPYLEKVVFNAPQAFPAIIYWQWLQWLAAHIFLYVLLSILCTFNMASLITYFKIPKLLTFNTAVYYFCLTTLLLFLLNQIYFPLSHFSNLTHTLRPDGVAYVFSFILGGLFLLNCLLTAWLYIKKSPFTFALFFGVIIILIVIPGFSLPDKPANKNQQRNIILIGIDSLRLQAITESTMPFAYQFLKNSHRFDHAYTPLARTYPSWVSILTGLYPKHHGALFNLAANDTLNSQASLAWELKQKGYHTLYATDEKRFSIINNNLGFSHTIGPQTGLNDFILGAIQDYPLSNLVINTTLGKYLFPFSYANRAHFITYYPSTFSQSIAAHLSNKQPLLLAVHFTLPHWPYQIAYMPKSLRFSNLDFTKVRNSLYPYMLKKVDEQISALFKTLSEKGILENAVVVLLSDHGETLEEMNSRLLQKTNYQGQKLQHQKYIKQNRTLNTSYGHGSDVLSPKQYQTLLAFRFYPNKRQNNQVISESVSLLDVKPTLIDLIGHSKTQTDGYSLLPLINGEKADNFKNRVLFFESGFNPKIDFSLDKKEVQQKLLNIRQKYYQILPSTGQLSLKRDMLLTMQSEKQYAITQFPWLLAIYPHMSQPIHILVNLNNLKWTDNLTDVFGQTAPIEKLNKQLAAFSDIKLDNLIAD